MQVVCPVYHRRLVIMARGTNSIHGRDKDGGGPKPVVVYDWRADSEIGGHSLGLAPKLHLSAWQNTLAPS